MLSGHVENGVVVFDTGTSLPEGTKVTVVPVSAQPAAIQPGAGDWDAALRAVQDLRETGYDFDAWRQLRDYEVQHAADHLP